PVSLESRAALAAQMHSPRLEIAGMPVERGKLSEGVFTIGSYQGAWSYCACQEDHLLNHSGVYSPASYLRSWAYTQLVCAEAMDVQLCLFTPGPADVWLNKKHLLRKATFQDQQAGPVVIPARLVKGANKIMIRFEALAQAACAHYLALRICDMEGNPISPPAQAAESGSLSVQIPSVIMPRLIELRSRMENLYRGMRLERDVFEREQEVALLFPNDATAEEIVTIRFKNAANLVFTDGAVEGKPGMRRRLNASYELVAGRYQIELLPRVWEYYEHNMRIKRDIAVWTVGNALYSTAAYASYAERRQEGLLKAVEQPNNLCAEMAKMAIGWWNRIEPAVMLDGVARVNRRSPGSRLDLATLLAIAYRFSAHPKFPEQLLQPLADCFVNPVYADPAADSVEPATDAESILTYTCEILAGQRFPDQTFAASGQSGEQHRLHGISRAAAWMQACGRAGFAGWGSSEELTLDLIALSLLVDLAEDEALAEMATVVMDK
ncbi:MAG: hypothetical protein IH586_14675, partial [Anaerolineaceae bacterium]|nr:hypothetical protein [Anaerolineaceae bacterium]